MGEQKIEIKASGGLSEEEINKMVKDGKLHEEEDKKFAELVTIRNNADSVIHTTEKTLKNLGDNISSINRAKIESSINDLKESLKKDDKASIESKINDLNKLSSEILSKANNSQSTASQTQHNDSNQTQKGSTNNNDAKEKKEKKNDDVVDAEFEEVKEDKK